MTSPGAKTDGSSIRRARCAPKPMHASYTTRTRHRRRFVSFILTCMRVNFSISAQACPGNWQNQKSLGVILQPTRSTVQRNLTKLWIVEGLWQCKNYFFVGFLNVGSLHHRLQSEFPSLTCISISFSLTEHFFNSWSQCSSTIRSVLPLNLWWAKTRIHQALLRMSPSDPLLWDFLNPSIPLPLGAASRTQAEHCTAAARRWCSQTRPLIQPTPACLCGIFRFPHSPSSVLIRGTPWTSTRGCCGTDISDTDFKVSFRFVAIEGKKCLKQACEVQKIRNRLFNIWIKFEYLSSFKDGFSYFSSLYRVFFIVNVTCTGNVDFVAQLGCFYLPCLL